MSKKITIECAIRWNKEYNIVELFYYDEHLDLVCFNFRESHGQACHEYYLSTQPITDKSPKEVLKRKQEMIEYYNDERTTLKVMKRLKYRVCSYAQN